MLALLRYLITLVILIPLLATAQEAASITDEDQQPPTLLELINTADLVAVVQVDDTRYEYLRNFPNKGVAWMTPLIVYKSDRDLEVFTVYEEGLKGDRCYFPKTMRWQEGNRFLVFLKHEEFIRYRGLSPLCYLAISVNSDNQYVLRLPVENVILPHALLDLAQDFQFTDSGSRVDATELLREEKARMISSRQMKDEGDTLVYTRGIPISALRKYINRVITAQEKASVKP